MAGGWTLGAAVVGMPVTLAALVVVASGVPGNLPAKPRRAAAAAVVLGVVVLLWLLVLARRPRREGGCCW